MTWARLDDRFHSHRKVMRAWKHNRAAIGLHVLALTYTCGHELDGHVDTEFVELLLPRPSERRHAVTALVDSGLWTENGSGWVIHDFLKFNPSAAELREKREKEAARKAAARASKSERTTA